ncbi:MAG: hypothetical protein HYV78_00400 [Candidatus Wildermuthbacteria bacterium]|nr:hypothetical protein [Candidatus Wildermuthbacteria bacterium]
MSAKQFMLIAGAIFSVIAALHLARIILQWDAAIGTWDVPIWLSWLAVPAAGFLGYTGLKQGSQL